MPSLSGLHMWRTISIGHSSRASRAITSSSGKRFFPKSRSDFRLSFKVFGEIIVVLSMSNHVLLANFVGEFGQELQQIVDHAYIRDLENRRLRVLVDGDDEGAAFDPGEMLERPADPAGQ